jgi:hypothetical protein
MICGPLISLSSSCKSSCPAADVDRHDRGCIFIEDHPVTANAEAVTVAALKSLHVALTCHGVSVKRSFHLLARVPGKRIDVFGGAQR